MWEKLDLVDGFKNVMSQLFNDLHLKAISVMSVWVAWVFGKDTEILTILASLIFFDTLTGFLAAIKHKNLGSKPFFKFSSKLVCYFSFLVLSRLVHKVVPSINAPIIVDGFLTMTEAISILENLSLLGFPVPKVLRSKLEIFKE